MASHFKIAEHLFLSRQAVSELLTKFDLPRKNCDLDVVREAYIRHLRAVASGRQSGGEFDLSEEKARYTYHQANIESIKQKQLEGELLPAELVQMLGIGIVSAARSKILSIHSKIKSRHITLSQQIIDDIDRFCREALEELADDGLPDDIRQRIKKHLSRLEAPAKAAN